ncbi:MAG: hypothetical protein E6J90_32480 [Deltaproteobacteria bacterium]|nr:MAG: hypothetical protein E6J90_32480 [Deltaproteobacteria bacterium]TMQ17236.1 MAG: hypothetical protein E6J91_10540 [Deltaproteobacteria bacterium]
MRHAALALMACLAGCSLTSSGSGECVNDSQCGEDVCAQGGECTARSNVRSVLVKWTIDGAAASLASCAPHPDLFVRFDGTDYGDTLKFAPVSCLEGQLTITTLPKRYRQVELGVEGGTGSAAPIDAATAQATFDLQ